MAGSTTDAAALAQRLLDIGERSYAPWLDRREWRDVIERGGLPRPRSEPWKYTNISRWYGAALAAAAAPQRHAPRLHTPREIEVVEFSDRRAAAFVQAWQGRAFDLAKQPLAAVNNLLLGAGVVVRVPAGTQATEPVHIEDMGAAYQQVLVLVEEEATLTLIEQPSPFTHRIVEIAVGTDARLRHLRRQAASPNRECSLVGVRVEAGARYALAQSSLGADLRRNDVLATLCGEGAEATIRAAWRLDGHRHLDNQIAVSHAAPSGFSRQTYRGVVGGRARAVLNGRIHIAPRAQATDAALSTKNLLQSTTAEVYAKPELEIHANDVKCSHGATVGTLDEDAIHYLRSRGVAEDTARALLVRGFLREAVEDLEGAERLRLFSSAVPDRDLPT